MRSRHPETPYGFSAGVVKLPAGDYELLLFDARTAQFRPGARCTVAATTTELRLPVATTDRVVRLQLRGLPGAGYLLKTVHENGRSSMDFGRADGRHTLLLPPGLCTAWVKTGPADRP
ncbi:MAG: hypothetical protein FJ265_19805 [Planctomycetes bacterium]|nr:hypothetical protein [Planctomycetota bacterium]